MINNSYIENEICEEKKKASTICNSLPGATIYWNGLFRKTVTLGIPGGELEKHQELLVPITPVSAKEYIF